MIAGSANDVYCDVCNRHVKTHHRFCHNCGEALYVDNTRITIFNNSSLRASFIFFIVYLFVSLLVQYTDWFDDYSQLFWIEIFLAAFTMFHVFKNFPAMKHVLKFHNFNGVRLTGCISLAIIFSVIVNIVVVKFNYSVFGSDTTYYGRYSLYSMPAMVMIYSIALNPAIIEELAFRGVLYNYLRMFLSERLVVIVTGVAFAIIHLSFISLIWLIPFGILAGAMRKRFGTIWYGVIFHFMFNLVAVLFDLYRHGHLGASPFF